ncbi:MAG: SUMF1/EgtB/PvdO family nonheme iron enzyme, partial [Bacteroidota bacterium]|nr:SUMF1/EgtB/PvdO family nonheme iron enzyme [Bacteroidota bacterium]
GFWMGETELTYSLWKEIYDWANDKGYALKSTGHLGSSDISAEGHPVTVVSWRDAIVWCNAFTDYYNTYNGDKPDYSYAYTYNNEPVKDSDLNNDKLEKVDYNSDATGFRIPTNAEWYAAASYKTTPDDYASGASADFRNEGANIVVAWYRANSDEQTHPAAMKLANLLGLYDMSGNVRELVFDKLDKYDGSNNDRGGAWNSNADQIAVSASFPITDHSSSHALGFRIARTIGDDSHEDIEITTDENEDDPDLGGGEGYFTLEGNDYPISKAVLLNFNSIGAGLLQLQFVSEGIEMDAENSGGYTGVGNMLDIAIYTTESDLISGKTYTIGDYPTIIFDAFTNINADTFPYEPDKSFIGAEEYSVEVKGNSESYTIIFSCKGLVTPSGEETTITGEYIGKIPKLNAGEDF